MIIGNLAGGLGNQMFQYACARAVSLDMRLPLKFRTDFLSYYKAHNGLELDRVFDLKLDLATDLDLARLIGWSKKTVFLRHLLVKRPFRKLAGKRFVTESDFTFWRQVPDPLLDCGAYLQGYWQSENYFANYTSTIFKDFTFRQLVRGVNVEIAKSIVSGVSISVHVRRGDYISNSKAFALHGTCSPEYYFAAIDALLLRCPGAKIFAFSDDPQWVAEVLSPRYPNLVLVACNTGVESYNDMHLMSLCRHHVIANSSFSWWGAWLNPRRDKMVVAPSLWFADGRDTGDLIPKGWERM